MFLWLNLFKNTGKKFSTDFYALRLSISFFFVLRPKVEAGKYKQFMFSHWVEMIPKEKKIMDIYPSIFF